MELRRDGCVVFEAVRAAERTVWRVDILSSLLRTRLWDGRLFVWVVRGGWLCARGLWSLGRVMSLVDI